MTRTTKKAAVVVALVIAAVTASNAAKPDRLSNDDVLQSLIGDDTALLVGNVSDATATFEQRLRQRVTAQGGVILVGDMPELATIEAFPATVPWSISCSRYFGLSVSFGSGTTDDIGIIEVPLSKASLTNEQCRQLLPILANKIVALLR